MLKMYGECLTSFWLIFVIDYSNVMFDNVLK